MSEPLVPMGDRRRLRVGLLGGSFNPAHEGHRHIARLALKHLALDQVWLLVSPGNPLKPVRGMAPFAERLAGAARMADGRRIVASGIEARLGTRFTVDTLRALRRRYPRVRFVWLMGADNLATFHRWRGWKDIARIFPFAVLPRPSYNHRALASRAARTLRAARVPMPAATLLAGLPAPAWLFLPVAQHAASATALRRRGIWRPGPAREGEAASLPESGPSKPPGRVPEAGPEGRRASRRESGPASLPGDGVRRRIAGQRAMRQGESDDRQEAAS